MTIESELLDHVSALLGRRDLSQAEYADWLAGTAAGGPGGDGLFPLTDSTGFTRLLPAPATLVDLVGLKPLTLPSFASIGAQAVPAEVTAIETLGYHSAGDGGAATYLVSATGGATRYRKQSVDGRWWSIATDIAHVDQFGAKGNVPGHDSQPAIQAAIDWNEARGGGFVQSGSGKHYYLGETLTINPARTGLMNMGAAWNWSLKSFTFQADMPQLLTNPGFDAGQTGWVLSEANVNAISFAGGAVEYVQAADHADYSSFGQKLVGLPAGAQLQVRATIEFIETSTSPPNNVQNSLLMAIGASRAADGTPRSIGTMGVNPSAVKIYRNTDVSYAEPQTVVWDVDVPASLFENPWLRIDSNASFRVSSFSVQVRPKNYCILVRCTGGPQYGHQAYPWIGMGLIGTNDNAAPADMMFFDSEPPLSSRVTIFGLAGLNFYRGYVFGNGTYLCSFHNCCTVTREAHVETLEGARDSGENICWHGGTMGGGRVGILNRGMDLHLFGVSIDFPRTWIEMYGGSIVMDLGWLEKEPAFSADQPYIDLRGPSTFRMKGRKIQIDPRFDGLPDPVLLDTPFRAVPGAEIILEDVDISGMRCTSDAMVAGGGTMICRRMRGASNVPRLAGRSPGMNRFADGSFEGGALNAGEIGMECWVVAPGVPNVEQPDRRTINLVPKYAATGTIALGSKIVTGVSGIGVIPGVGQGYAISGPGIPTAAVVVATNSSGSTFGGLPANSLQMTMEADESASGVALTLSPRTPTGGTGLALSSALAHSGTRSLRFYKSGGLSAGTGSVAYLAFAVEPGCMAGFEAWIAFAGVGGASDERVVYFQASWVQLIRRPGMAAPIVAQALLTGLDGHIRVDASTGDIVGNDMGGGTGAGFQRVAFATSQTYADRFAPEWATHLMIGANTFSLAAGCDMHFDDMIGTIC